MTNMNAIQAATTFRALHQLRPLILPNAWDAASAALIESAGAVAIATTSAGVSWACGAPDGQGLTRDRMLQALAEIIAVVRVPVTADIESGYGAASDELGATVSAIVEIGVAGVNIEDRIGAELLDPSTQAERIEAARVAADRLGVPLWINARTDTFLAGAGDDDDERVRATMTRAEVYRSAGADSLFVPGVVDLALIGRLATGPLPINVMVGPGAPSVAELHEIGVARISVGSAIAEAAYALAVRATEELLSTGTYASMNESVGYGRLNGMLQARAH